MRDTLDELIDTVSLLWERAGREETEEEELEDVLLHCKAAILVSECETYMDQINPRPSLLSLFFGKSKKETNKKIQSQKSKFRFGNKK